MGSPAGDSTFAVPPDVRPAPRGLGERKAKTMTNLSARTAGSAVLR